MTEKELYFHFAGLAMAAMIDSSVSRSPGQLADAAFNYAEWMLAETYKRNRYNVLTGVANEAIKELPSG